MKLLCTVILLVLVAWLGANPAGKNNADIYFDYFMAGNYDACHQMSSAMMQDALPTAKLQETWETISSQLGGYLGLISSSSKATNTLEVHVYSLNFKMMVFDMQVSLNEEKQVAGLFFTPSAVPKPGTAAKLPDYLSEAKIEAVEAEFLCEGYKVSGMLTKPLGLKSYPLVLMLSGSGPNDMDETVGMRKPLRDIANGLANMGIASLRWTKRTRTYPESFATQEGFTISDEYLTELNAAISWLKEKNDPQVTKYFALGHSMGAYILPMAAGESKDIAGYIMLAANARPLEDLVVEQYQYILGQDGLTAEEQLQLSTITAQAQAVKNLSTKTAAPDTLLLNLPKAYWMSLNGYNQLVAFKQTTKPFLILQGEKDYQVSMVDFKLWQDAAKGKTNVVLKSYPDLDHLFMERKGISTPESYMEEGYVAWGVINGIAGWIRQQR